MIMPSSEDVVLQMARGLCVPVFRDPLYLKQHPIFSLI